MQAKKMRIKIGDALVGMKRRGSQLSYLVMDPEKLCIVQETHLLKQNILTEFEQSQLKDMDKSSPVPIRGPGRGLDW